MFDLSTENNSDEIPVDVVSENEPESDDFSDISEDQFDLSDAVDIDDIDDLLAQADELADLRDEQAEITQADDIEDIDDLLAQANELADDNITDIEQSLNDTASFTDEANLAPAPLDPATASAIYNADIIDQPYLLTRDEQDSLMETGAAQHLVNALDQMIGSSATNTGQIASSSVAELNQLDEILASTLSTDKPIAVASEIKEQQLSSQLDKFEQENSYIDIDKLLDASASSENKTEPYHNVDLDIGLDEFPEVIPVGEHVDVDVDPNDSSKKLDLARAYLEIDDHDSAREILEQIEIIGDKQQQKEARKLMMKLEKQ